MSCLGTKSNSVRLSENCVIKTCLLCFFLLGQLNEGIWGFQQNVQDEEIKTLSNTLPFIIESALANSTNKKYFHRWKTWVDWSNSKLEVNLCPANPFDVAIFLNHILFTSGKKGSIVTAF